MRQRGILLVVFAVSACESGLFEPDIDPDAPTDLSYQLIPSGDPGMPLGILLQWTPPRSGRAVSYDVYARSDARDDFLLRATTTSPSFHDAGLPQLDYYVLALDQDGQEMGQTDVVTVDERNRLPAPNGLVSVTLNGGVQLSWDPNAYEAAPQLFELYRVYSTPFDLARGCDESGWSLEGTTVSDEFVVRNLANGVTQCFAVSTISRDGHESVWSGIREDTPRYDARNVVLDASDVRRGSSGFAFMRGAGVAFGSIVADTNPIADVVLERRADGALWLRATRADVRIAQYGVTPVSELTSIDRAPSTGYGDAARMLAGYGYVIRAQYADGIHFAAIRVVHVATDFVLFDFAVQSQVGSGELARAAP
jgi:hypothetical protein